MNAHFADTLLLTADASRKRCLFAENNLTNTEIFLYNKLQKTSLTRRRKIYEQVAALVQREARTTRIAPLSQ